VLVGEAAEELGNVFIRVVGADGLLLDSGHLGHGVLADLFVGRPMPFLAFLGAVICGHTTTTEAEWFDCGLFDGPTSVAYADAPLSVAMTRRGGIVGGGGSGVVGGHGVKLFLKRSSKELGRMG